MGPGNPIEALSDALGAAIHRDLPDITYQDRDWEEFRKTKKDVRVTKTRRPEIRDIEVILFPQTWGSTALGYGGMGGAAITDAYTIIVVSTITYCVYFGHSRLAYRVDLSKLSPKGREDFLTDVKNRNMASCKESTSRYQ